MSRSLARRRSSMLTKCSRSNGLRTGTDVLMIFIFAMDVLQLYAALDVGVVNLGKCAFVVVYGKGWR
jgi:hypothetical protein